MNKKTTIGLFAITLVLAALGSVAAMEGRLAGIDAQSRDNITNAIKANDFNAWKTAIISQLTQDNFNKIVQRYQTMSQRHANITMYSGKLALNEGMIQALKDGNYDAWKTAAANSKSPLVSKITNEDQFKTLVQLYQAKQEGNFTKVKDLSSQLGLPVGTGKQRMYRHSGR